MDAPLEELLDELIGRLDEDPGYDVESFLAQHPREQAELLVLLERVRAQGLLPAQPVQAGALERIRRRFGLKTRKPALRAELSTRFLEGDSLLPHRVLGARYETLGEIADTSLNRLFCVRDRDLSREVAMKLAKLPEELAGGPSGSEEPLERFLTEAQVTSQLTHPGIVPVHDLGITADDRVYFTMKLVRGESLREIIDRLNAGEPHAVRRFPLPRLLQIVQRVCEAVAYAHSRGVVHRDLKPGNVMVGRFGEVQVMDWGLAKLLGDEEGCATGVAGVENDDWTATASGKVFGTPSYMAPEQARGEVERIDARTDVFGVGALLYHLLAGRPPYWGGSSEEVLERAREGELNDPEFRRALRPVPRELACVCRKALSAEREERYGSVSELEQDLDAFLEDRVGSAWSDPLPAYLVKTIRRRPTWTMTLLAALLGALLVVVAVYVSTLRDERALRDQARADRQMVERLDELLNDHAATPSRLRVNPFGKSENYLRAFADYDLPLDGTEPRAQVAAAFAAVHSRDPVLHGNLVDGLYELSMQLELGSVDRAAKIERQPLTEAVKRSGNPTKAELLQWVHHRYPDLVEFWPRLESLLPVVDHKTWRVKMWPDWRRGRLGENRMEALQAHIAGVDLAECSGFEIRWLAHVAGEALGPEQELELLERAAIVRPDQFPTRFRLATLADRRGDLQSAIEHCKAALAIRRDSARAQINLGIFLTDAERYEEAVLHLRKAIELDPESATPYSMLGYAYRGMNEFAEAIEQHEKAVELDPTESIFLHNLAETHLQLARSLVEANQIESAREHSDRAIAIIRRAIQADANQYPSYGVLFEAILDQGRLADALDELEQLDSGDPRVWGEVREVLLDRLLGGSPRLEDLPAFLLEVRRAFDR